MYVTGHSSEGVRAIARRAELGVLLRPGGNRYALHVRDYVAWAADNGQYTTGQVTPTDEEWWTWLVTTTRRVGTLHCLFATAPDVLRVIEGEDGPIVVGDAVATVERSRPWLSRIRALGLPAALIAQDGAEKLVLPWSEFDVLFLGGSTEWKIGPGAKELTRVAKLRDKRVHMGRVNSKRRLMLAASWGVDSVDGTFLAFGPTQNLPRLLAWYGRSLNDLKETA